jgi:metallo-beta-lactamase class B
MKDLKSYAIGLIAASGLGFGLLTTNPLAQSANTADAHVAAAKAAAGTEHTEVFNSLCAAPAPAPAQPAQPAQQAPAGARAQGPPPRSAWHVEPAKVFDNLYYLGQSEYSAWAVTTSQGIIVIDTLFDYSVEDEIVGGLTTLGLDPKNIKYVIVSHAHSDHVGGAKLLQDRFNAHVLMSQADWDLAARNTQSWPKPRRDMVITDGQKLTLGDTTLTMYLTPGHTPGTVSTIVPVRDNGRPHVAAEWGGTGFNFTITPDKPRRYWFETYASSADHFRDAVKRSGADVLFANHPNQDGAKAKLAALAKRKAGDPNPYVIGNDSVARYVTMVGECARAGLARLGPSTR